MVVIPYRVPCERSTTVRREIKWLRPTPNALESPDLSAILSRNTYHDTVESKNENNV